MKPSERQIANGTFKLVDGLWHKRCTGPAHDEPAYLPATEKYFYTHKSGPMTGRLVPRCRLCVNWAKLKSPGSEHGYVPVRNIVHLYREVVNRIGTAELHRRTGLSPGHIRGVLQEDLQFVKKAQLKRLMLELVSVRRKNERSINKHSKWRVDRANDNNRQSGERTERDMKDRLERIEIDA